MLEILILTIKILFLLFFVGFGFTYIFLPKKIRKYAFFLIPWFGIILIAVLGVLLSVAKLPMNVSKNIIFLISSSLLIYSFLLKRVKLDRFGGFWILLILSAVTLLYNLYPLLIKVGYPTTISFGNLDPLSYSTVADFLTTHSVSEAKPLEHFKPYLWSVWDLIYGGFRWGSPMILSFFSSTFKIQSYQIFSIFLTTVYTLIFPLIYIFTAIIYKKSNKYTIFIIFFTFSLNSTLLYMLYNVFFAQFVFTGILILSILLVYSYLADKNRALRGFNSYDLLIGLSLSSVTTIYPEGFIFAYIPLVIFTSFSLFGANKNQFIGRLAKITLVLFIINPISFGTTVAHLLRVFTVSINTSFIGWEKIPHASPMEILGFWNLYYSRNFPWFLDLIIGLPILIIWIYGLRKIERGLLFGYYLGFFLVFYVLYKFIFDNFFIYHRVVTYSIFLYVILFAVGVSQVFQLIKSSKKKLIILFIFAALTFRSSYRTIYQFYWHPRVVDKSLISLNQLNSNESISEPFYTPDVYFPESDVWTRLWREYFLHDKKIVTRQNFTIESKQLKSVKLVLTEKNKLIINGKKLIFKNIIWQNQYYQLGEIYPLGVADDLQVKKNK